MGSQVGKGRRGRQWKLGGGGFQPQVVLQDLEGYIKEVPSPSRSFCVCVSGRAEVGGDSPWLQLRAAPLDIARASSRLCRPGRVGWGNHRTL